jgi:hypothetical protein
MQRTLLGKNRGLIMVTFNELTEELDLVSLQFNKEELEKAWASEQQYSYDAAKWNAFLNRLSLNILIPWLEEESNLTPEICHNLDELPSIWEVVNGSAINLKTTRLILVPSEGIGTEEFSVPQEWIDIPTWAGEIYLAVQISVDDCWLRVWGYATHEKLKEEGIYDNFERTYTLKKENVSENLEAVYLAIKQNIIKHRITKKIPTLSNLVINNLLKQLSKPSLYSPRLDINFEDWAVLLENNNHRQRLYEQRLNQQPLKNSQARSVNLSQWFDNIFDAGWQQISEILVGSNLSFALKGEQVNINELIKQIYQGKTKEQLRQAAKSLKAINTSNSEVITALIHLIRNAPDDKTRWTAAESLWVLDPENSAGGKVRVSDLEMLLQGHPVALMVAILDKGNQQYDILLRVYPIRDRINLPSDLQLTVLDQEEKPFLEKQVRSIDNYIELKFSGDQGDIFKVKITLTDARFFEDFVI